MKHLLIVAVFAVVSATASGCAGSSGVSDVASPTSELSSDAAISTVQRVVDGDTIVLDQDKRVRIIGLDTPESVHPTNPIECFGPEASDFLSQTLPVGTEVRIELGQEPVDTYGRTLAYIWRASDDLFVNEHLLATGHAEVLTIAPNDDYAEVFTSAEARASEAGLGLWAAC